MRALHLALLALALLLLPGASAGMERLGTPALGVALVALREHYVSDTGVWRESNGWAGLQEQAFDEYDAEGKVVQTWPADTRLLPFPLELPLS